MPEDLIRHNLENALKKSEADYINAISELMRNRFSPKLNAARESLDKDYAALMLYDKKALLKRFEPWD